MTDEITEKNPLKRYLDEEGLSLEKFGERIGKSYETVRRWSSDIIEVPPDMRPVIEEATGGKVKFHKSIFAGVSQ